MPRLDDGVLLLRPLAGPDAAAFAAMNRDPEAVRWSRGDPHYSVARAAEHIARAVPRGWAEGHTRRFGVQDLAGGRLVGTVALHSVHDGGASVGIKMLPEARGRGLALRAVRLLVRYAFDDAGLGVLHWYAPVGHQRSLRLARRAGFRLEGTVRGLTVAADGRHDGWILSLTPADPAPAGGAGALEVVPVTPRLADGRVVLRALRHADAEPLVEICRDPAAVRWTTVPPDYRLPDARRYIHETVPAGWAAGTEHSFAVADAGTARLLGTVSLHHIRPGAADVGINFGPAARGRGLAERACRLLLDYGFEQLGLSYITWKAFVPNWASRKLAFRLGFGFDGLIRGHGEYRGAPADQWVLTLAAGQPRHPTAPWDGPPPPAARTPAAPPPSASSETA